MHTEKLTDITTNLSRCELNKSLVLMLSAASAGNLVAIEIKNQFINMFPSKKHQRWNPKIFELISHKIYTRDDYTKGHEVKFQIAHPDICGSFNVFLASNEFIIMSVDPALDTTQSDLNSFAMSYMLHLYCA
ncbi:hypothetical protein IMW75_24840 [Pseudomonas gregormendelii]|uniref:Uncharacterized protein n=1 Tax=Pseudomonas gregormendelii TaxID=1628277 RepID=A0ABS3ARL5_9PSED|nr:hypothetical protein [Pseudomonas gregormendelii]MBN3968484.1 hypothetical protein [Pseudomonas gregormendelii]